MIQRQWQIVSHRRPSSAQEVLEILLHNRGQDMSFLDGSLKDLQSHLTMRGMDEGAELMARHLCRGSKVVLVGDYDCDGITSLAQFSLFLRDIAYRNYEVVIPNRAEGYGIPERAIKHNADAGLFVALDCGTFDVQALGAAQARGADSIVIDHHEVSERTLAPATVLINPKQPGCPSEFKDFCAAGLTLLFLARLRRALDGMFAPPVLGSKYLALAAVGTVADIVPLVDANRILTQCGLHHIARGSYLPLSQVAESAGISGKTVSAGHVAYYLGPRINAAGRMGDPKLAYDLLLAERPLDISRLAQELNRLNSRRQHQEDLILEQIRKRFTLQVSAKRTCVMEDAGWSPGIIGIIASRIVQELHYGPAVVFSVDETRGIARGSARSVPGFDICAALHCCDNLLLKWGGHKMAAGVTVTLEKLEAFAARFEQIARDHDPDLFVPRGKVDMELAPGLVSPDLLAVLQRLEPHGQGNPAPTFAACNVPVLVQKNFGKKQNHLRLLIGDCVSGVFWRGTERLHADYLKDGSRADVVFSVEWDAFVQKPRINIKDIGHLF